MEENTKQSRKKSEKCAIYGSHAEVKAKINSFSNKKEQKIKQEKWQKSVDARVSVYSNLKIHSAEKLVKKWRKASCNLP